MNFRTTSIWIVAAAGLFAFIFFYQRHQHKAAAGPIKVLPNLKSEAVTSVQVRPKGQLEIRADRTNGVWELTEPLRYPAQLASIENFLAAMERLSPATYITAAELKDQSKADEEHGFSPNPQATLIIQQDPFPRVHILIGTRTAPGDQVFVQVVGVEGIYVVDAEVLKLIPNSANDWRDTTLINLNGLAFDRIAVTNGAKIFEVQRDPTNQLWGMVFPMQARADNARLQDSLQKLQGLRIHQFVSDDPKADLESLGLQTPDLQLALASGTNIAALLQFGKSPTNDSGQVYARRVGENTIVTVTKDLTMPWHGSVNDFRDPHLLTLTTPVGAIDVRADDAFSLLSQTNETWRVMPQNYPGDAHLVKELLAGLCAMQVVQFAKDFVTGPDLPEYGLAPPARRYILRSSASLEASNAVIADLSFGTNRDDKVFFAGRADELFVYAVKRGEVDRLPTASWQVRDRQIWNFSINDAARATIRQRGKERQLIRKGPHEWSLAPGSQGMINDLAVEEIVSGLGHLATDHWVAIGEQNRARYGFASDGHQLALELKNGSKLTVEFGKEARPGFPYAAVTFDREVWIFEFPGPLYQEVLAFLTIPIDIH